MKFGINNRDLIYIYDIYFYIMHINLYYIYIYRNVKKVECCGVNWEIWNLKKKRTRIKYSEQKISYVLQAYWNTGDA